MRTCAWFRRCRFTIRRRRASSSRSPSTRARATGSARSISSRASRWSIRKRFTAVSGLGAGDVYNAEAVEKSVENLSIEVARRGYPFAVVRPRGDRDLATHTISVVFTVEDGPRVYIERINIRGNTRTRDYVIRREFDVGEGDAYNRALIDRAERRLKNLNYFKTVKITNEPGSAPGSHRAQRRCRGDPDRRVLGRGRLFDRQRLDGRAQRRRTQSARPGPVCQGVGAIRPIRARHRAVVRRAVFHGAAARRRHRSLCQANAGDELHFVQQPNHRHGNARRICAERRAFVPGSLQHLFAENHAAVCNTTTVSSRPTP